MIDCAEVVNSLVNKKKTNLNVLNYQISRNLCNKITKQEKNQFFSNFFTELKKNFEKNFETKKEYDMEPIFSILILVINLKNSIIPDDFFMLLNFLFEHYKKSDSEKMKNFVEDIYKLFDNNKNNFILKFFNELFEIVIYCKISQNKELNEEGNKLESKLKKTLKNSLQVMNEEIFDFNKFEILLLEKTNFDLPILTKLLLDWINTIIEFPLINDYFGKTFIDLMPWIIKTKNSNVKIKSDCEKNIKNRFLKFIKNNIKNKRNIEEMKKSILSFVILVRKQKESDQQKEYEFLNNIISEIYQIKKQNILNEIFPYETLNQFLLLIITTKNVDIDLENLNLNLKDFISDSKFKDFNQDDFKETIQKGIENPNLNQVEETFDWYNILKDIAKDKIKGNMDIDIINIVLNTIKKNNKELDKHKINGIKDNNENLFLLMMDYLEQNNIINLFELIVQCIKEKNDFNFKYILVGYLNTYILNSKNNQNLKQSLFKLKTDDNSLFNNLFNKLYKLFSINPICLLIFCIYMDLYELSWELILKFKEVKLEKDFYIYLVKFIQAFENSEHIKKLLLYPNKNIFLIKCLYGILMLLPQGKAFDILSDRLNGIRGLIKKRNEFNFYEGNNNNNIDDKNHIEEYIKIFMDVQNEKKNLDK